MTFSEKRVPLEVFQRRKMVEGFLDTVSNKGFRFGIAEDRGIVADAVTVAGSTRAFDFATTVPHAQPSAQQALTMANSIIARLDGNNTLAGNIGIGITRDESSQRIFYAYASTNNPPVVYDFEDTKNDDNEIAVALQGAQAYLQNKVLIPQPFIFSENPLSNENEIREVVQKISQFANGQGWLIASAESCTGAFLAKQFAKYHIAEFVGGTTLYNEQQKMKEGISAEQLSHGNVYSEEVALAMARVTSRNYRAHIAVATSGVMENPDTRPFHEQTTPGTMYYAFLISGKPFSGKINLSPTDANGIMKTREALKKEAGLIILNRLLQSMEASASLFSKYQSVQLS